MDPDVARPGANKIPSRHPSTAAAVGTLLRQAEQAHRNNSATTAAPNNGSFIAPGGDLIFTAVGAVPSVATVRLSAPGRGADFVIAHLTWGVENYGSPGGSVTDQRVTIGFGVGGVVGQIAPPTSGGSVIFDAWVQLNTDINVSAAFVTSPTPDGWIDIHLAVLGVSALLPNVRFTF